MRRSWLIAALACVVFWALIGLAIWKTVDASAQSATGRIEITATTVDVRVMGQDRNEYRLLWNLAVRSRPIGHAYQHCAYMGSGFGFGHGTSYCQATYILPRGKIAVAGPRHNRRHATYPVLGGTGIYSGAQGVLQVVPDSPSQLHLTFILD